MCGGAERASRSPRPIPTARSRPLGLTIGVDTPATIEDAAKDLFAVYDISLVGCLHAIGPSLAGDMMMAWQDLPWVFHAAPFVAASDECYDYKAERQHEMAKLAADRQASITAGWRAAYARAK